MRKRYIFVLLAVIASFVLYGCKDESTIDSKAAGAKARGMVDRVEKATGADLGKYRPGEQQSVGGMGKKVTKLEKEVFTTPKGVVIIKENTVTNLTGSRYTDAETGISVAPVDPGSGIMDTGSGF